MPRKYTKVHDQLLVDVLTHFFKVGNFIIYPRVGNLKKEFVASLSPEEKRAASPWRLRPDGFAWDEEKFYIIELIVRPNEWYKYAKLIEYEKAFKRDPEYVKYHHLKTEMWLVSPEINEIAERLCKEYGVKFIKYAPSWVIPYTGSLRKRDQRPSGQSLESIS